MKRYLTLVLFLLAAVTTYATWPSVDQVTTPPSGISGWDNSGQTWRPVAVNPSDGKLMTDAAVTIGSVTVTPGTPPTENLHTAVSVTNSAQDVASLANRQSISIWNHDGSNTIWVSLDSATASATTDAPSIPIRPYGFLSVSLDSSKILSLITSTTATATVYQDGY